MIEPQSRSLNPRRPSRFAATRVAPGNAARNHDVDANELVAAAESSPIAHLGQRYGRPMPPGLGCTSTQPMAARLRPTPFKRTVRHGRCYRRVADMSRHDVPSTLIGVAVLDYPDQLVEVEAVAILPLDRFE